MDADYARVETAIRFLRDNLARHPSLDEVAAHVGLSRYHFQRLFRRRAGLSPRQYLEYLAVEQAWPLLRQAHSVLDTACELGLTSASRLHEPFVAVEATGAGEYKRSWQGVEIRYGLAPGPFGEMLIAQTPRGICFLSFVNARTRRRERERLQRLYRLAELREDAVAACATGQAVFAPRDAAATPLRVAVSGTGFQISVWRALLGIPRGTVVSYSALAAATGRPAAVRALANAVAANPVNYLIPCHRVVRADGSLGGYRGGADLKRQLLEWEATGPADQPQAGRRVPPREGT